ncbi:reverse transcriptase domain-containing protein [Tanacetum coccineum]
MTQSIIEGHVSALKKLLKQQSNRDLIKPMLLNFNDDIQDTDDKEHEANKGNDKRKTFVTYEDLSKPFMEVLKYGKARAWFDKLPPGSMGNWGDMQGKFMNRFGMLRACAKDPPKISKIIRKANESLSNFKERWVSESNAIPNVSKMMQISSFMSSHKCPKLSKRFSDNIPKTFDEMLKRVDDYVRSKEAFRDTELPKGEFMRKETQVQWGQRNDLPRRGLYENARHKQDHRPPFRPQERHALYVAPHRPHQDFRRPREYHKDNRAVLTLDSLMNTPKEILTTEHQLCLPQPPPLVRTLSKENMNKYCDYHNEKGHGTNDCFHLKKQLEIALESGKLNHLVKDVRQRGKGGQKGNGHQKGKIINMVRCPPVLARDLLKEALLVDAEVEGYLVRRIHVDEGASIEIMYEHCFNMIHPSIRARLTKTQTTVSGFSREQVKPLGKIELDVCFGGDGLCRRGIMKFTVISAPSPYNIILGHLGLKQLRAISSTIHGMMKFLSPWRIATLVS